MNSVALITSQAFSLVNFREPLIRDLIARNVKVYALAPDYSDDLRKKILDLGACPIDYSLVRTGMSPFRDVLDTLRMTVLLRKLRPDVTLGYFIKPVIYGSLAAWLARVPRRAVLIAGLGYVFTQYGNAHSMRRKVLRYLVSRLYRLGLSCADQVIFQNDDDLAEFVHAGTVRVEKAVRISGTGVDLEEWPFIQPVEEPITFLLAARLLREKGILEYAEAARLVKSRYPDARFILLGGLDPNPGGLSAAEVQAWVDEGLLEWPGHVPVKSWLAQTSVYVLPSYYREGVPRSTQEAMAMGRPVITTDSPGCRDTVIEGENGFLVPVRNPEALAQAMLRFIENPSLIDAMGQKSRMLAEQRFDVHKINLRMLEVLGVMPDSAPTGSENVELRP